MITRTNYYAFVLRLYNANSRSNDILLLQLTFVEFFFAFVSLYYQQVISAADVDMICRLAILLILLRVDVWTKKVPRFQKTRFFSPPLQQLEHLISILL